MTLVLRAGQLVSVLLLIITLFILKRHATAANAIHFISSKIQFSFFFRSFATFSFSPFTSPPPFLFPQSALKTNEFPTINQRSILCFIFRGLALLFELKMKS